MSVETLYSWKETLNLFRFGTRETEETKIFNYLEKVVWRGTVIITCQFSTENKGRVMQFIYLRMSYLVPCYSLRVTSLKNYIFK